MDLKHIHIGLQIIVIYRSYEGKQQGEEGKGERQKREIVREKKIEI